MHAAEDRGAHGDGKPGTGHDPRRSLPPPLGATHWRLYYDNLRNGKPTNCDKKDENKEGFDFGVKQGARVLYKFAKALHKGDSDSSRKPKDLEALKSWRSREGLAKAWSWIKNLFT